MEINTALHIHRNKRSFFISFFTLSFVLVFPLFFDFNGQQAISSQANTHRSNNDQDLVSKKAKPDISIAAGDIK